MLSIPGRAAGPYPPRVTPLDPSSRSAVFRSAVLIGVAALLAGVAGIFYFRHRESTQRADRPQDACTVIVHGLSSVEGIALVAAWHEASGGTALDHGLPGREAGVWRFRHAPEGTPLTLRIERHLDGRVELIHEQPAVFTRGAVFEAWVPGTR